MKQPYNITNAFDDYRQLISNITNDLEFWKSFLNLSIKNYQSQEIKPEKLYASVFISRDIDVSLNIEHLISLNSSTSIMTDDLEIHRKLFFTWIMNLSLLKSYNALEIFLLKAIWLNYFPTLKNPTIKKKNTDELKNSIKAELKKIGLVSDTKNNRYLIEFLKYKAMNFEKLLSLQIRADLKTTWKDFFDMISVLRNIMVHQGTIITDDTLNEIKSTSKDIFERHFDILSDENGDKHINPKENDLTSLIWLMNDFGLNSVKLIYNKPDLEFIGMIIVPD